MNIILVLLIVMCFATSLFIVWQSWKTFVNNHDESHAIVLGCSVFYSFVYLCGAIIRSYRLVVPAVENSDSIEARVTSMGMSLDMFYCGMAVALVFIAAFNLILAWIIKKDKWVMALQLGAIVVTMCIGSVLATVVNWQNPIVNFFTLCCGIMSAYAWILDLTYKEFCVIGNIYLQITLCLIASITPLWLAVKLVLKRGLSAQCLIQFFVCAINLVAHLLLFVIVCVHYWMPLDKGFDMCYDELNACAAATGLSYAVVNLIIFVFFFLLDIAFNACLYIILKKINPPLSVEGN